MPYKTNSALPDSVKNHLPNHAQDIYREAFNHAHAEYKDAKKRRDHNESLEEISHKVAWSAVKKSTPKGMMAIGTPYSQVLIIWLCVVRLLSCTRCT